MPTWSNMNLNDWVSFWQMWHRVISASADVCIFIFCWTVYSEGGWWRWSTMHQRFPWTRCAASSRTPVVCYSPFHWKLSKISIIGYWNFCNLGNLLPALNFTTKLLYFNIAHWLVSLLEVIPYNPVTDILLLGEAQKPISASRNNLS